MTIQTVLNVTQTALVIDTAGHLLGSREPYLYDDSTISAANFAILQAHLNSGRLRLLTGGVTIPSPSQGASFVSVTIQGQNLVFTDSLGGTSTVAVPGGDVDLSAYVRADDLEAVPDLVLQSDLSTALSTKVNSSTYVAGLASKIDAASALLVQAGTPDAMVSGVINRDSNGSAIGFAVVWPDGATGMFAGVASTGFPGAVDSYTITHTLGGSTQTYTQAAVTRDTNGAVTNRSAITVADGAPAVIPVAPTMTATAKTDTTVTINATGGVNVASLVVKRGATTVATAFPFTDTGLTQATPYTYTVTVTSSSGATATSTLGVTTNATPVVPVAETLTATAGAAGSGQVTITATGGSNIASRSLYRGTTSTVATTGTPIATSFPYVDTGLTAGTFYYKEVVASSSGNTASSATVSATLAAAPDSTPPTAPTAVTAAPGNARVTLTPTGATDNMAVTGYNAYTAATGGSPVATGASPLVVTGLTNGTAYTYYVSALDAAGNESGRTASNAATPSATPAAGTVYLADNMVGVDGAPIEGRSLADGSDTSKVWAHQTDSRFLINGNRARAATSPTGGSAFATVNAGATAYKVKATFPTLLASTTARKIGLVFRFQDSANTWRVDPNGGTWLVRKIVAGTATTVITGPTAVGGDIAEVTVGADNSISLTINGAAAGTAATGQTDLATAQMVGIYGQAASGSTGATVQDQTSALRTFAVTAV